MNGARLHRSDDDGDAPLTMMVSTAGLALDVWPSMIVLGRVSTTAHHDGEPPGKGQKQHDHEDSVGVFAFPPVLSQIPNLSKLEYHVISTHLK